MAQQGVERRLAAILCADVAGYSRLMGADEAGTLARLKSHRAELIDPKIAEHHGRIVKVMGDGVLVEFPSVVDAVQCAVDIQRTMAERNAGVPEERRITFRIGINLGDVIIEGDDIYGDGVNVAARLEAIADPGGLAISGKVYEEVKNKLPVNCDDLGPQRVKNIAEPVRVYRVQIEPGTAARVSRMRRSGLTKRLWAAFTGMLVLLVGAAAVVTWERYLRPATPAPTLKLLTGLSENEFTVFKYQILPKFENQQRVKQNRPVTVEVENANWDDVIDRLRNGEKIDLITFDVNGSRRELVEPKELIEDLTDEKGLLPTAVHPAMAKHLEIRTKRYFIPFRANIRLIFLNKVKYAELKKECIRFSALISQTFTDELIEKCRSLPNRPETWQDFKDIAEIFHTRDDEERVAIAATQSDKALFLYEMIRSALGEPCHLTDTQLGELENLVEFIKRGLWPHVKLKSREFDWKTASGFLLSDDVYLARDWSFSLTTLHEAGSEGKFDVYEGLRWEGSKPSYLLGGEFLALPKSARHPKLAKELLRFLVSRDVQRMLREELSWPAMRVDAAPRPESWQHVWQERINRALLRAEPLPDYWTREVGQLYENLFDKIVDSEADAKDAVVEFQDITSKPGLCPGHASTR